ncbi:putative Response regulator, CheY like (Modular protein) [Nitrospira japonica]|uniref:Putative Response regulator, CheY like (Modular protein) n=1 Tax=Nitrospira japonica TaxID=1325564 RepID=A0A1W1I892_9BACT|nr:response regulator [Nitrospira japonica]SLM49141.1 putative Response regulator, CheY like (Modular protein) [Nitrospira japonica]
MPSTIYIIDSSPAVRRMVEQISTPEGYEVIGFQDGPTALEAARKQGPTLIIADYHLDNMTFSGFCKEVHKLDTLSETLIISLVGAADRLDESHLRALGVKAFLKKPFQTEHLLDLIKDLDRSTPAQANGAKKKRRAWPPVSSATDSDDDEADTLGDYDQTGEIEAQVIPPPSQKEPVMASTVPTKPPAAEPEDAIKGLFGQLMQSMTEKAEKKITEVLPDMIAKDLAVQVSKAVEVETRQHVGATLTQERLAEFLEPVLKKELPNILVREFPAIEPILRSGIVEFATPLIKDQIDLLAKEQAEAIKAAVPAAVREHLKSIDDEIAREIRKAATEKAEALAEDLVRTAANNQVQQTVLELVPGIAEEQVKNELKRLTEAA